MRYFRFQDGLIFGGFNSNSFGDSGGAYAGYLNTGVTNSLVGFQLGTRIDYFVLPRVRLLRSAVGGPVWQPGVDARAPVLGRRRARFRRDRRAKHRIDLSGGYQITPRFSAFAAYRLLGVTRVGLADNQIPPFWADQQGMQNIKTNGALILHGVMMGGMWNF